MSLTLLRAVAVLALLLLLWNPTRSRAVSNAAAPPLVLLDASLSMDGYGGVWRAALDSARAAARANGNHGIIWRFGDQVAGFDSAAPPPRDGASRLGPGLEAAAARGGPVTVVTDGGVTDLSTLPPDLQQRARFVVLPRAPFADAFVASIAGPRRVAATDTIRLVVSFGRAGSRDAGGGIRGGAVLAVSAGTRRLTSVPVVLPDSGIVSTTIPLPATRLPVGWSAIQVRMELPSGADAEPRDDARLWLVETSAQPAAVILAAPPDWESRFLGRTLSDVARVPVKLFAQVERDGGWRDGTTLAPVGDAEVERAVRAARLVVFAGERPLIARARGWLPPTGTAVLNWATALGQNGDWYLQPPPPSPLAGMLAGLPWDSLPPATSATALEPTPNGGDVTALTARLSRRGVPQAVALLSERGGRRAATIGAGGLWRWGFRGGAPELAYRSLVASLADWLLGGGAGRGERFAPVANEVANGLPIAWRWTASAPAHDIVIGLQNENGERVDTLRFDAGGRAALRLPPGVYRYAARDAGAANAERGLVAVELYSDEWRPAAPAVTTRAGAPGAGLIREGLRDRWWLFALAIAALTAEWVWRRRMGLP